MKQPVSLLLLLMGMLFFLTSCDDEEEPYPSAVTELADCLTDNEGTLYKIVLDDDTQLNIANKQKGLHPNALYRCLTDFTLQDGAATLYTLKSCPLLFDSTHTVSCDPLNVVSLWKTNRYLNLHLRPKGQEFQHCWGYAVDSLSFSHAYLRLHHRQGNDPLSYSDDIYASLPLDSLQADTLTLRIATFEGMRQWTFAL